MPQAPATAVAGEEWMEQANCAYGVQAEVAGLRVLSEDGEPVMERDRFNFEMDRLFHGGHDDKPSSGSESRRLVRAVTECLDCPVRRECLQYAVEVECSVRNGIYGGTTRWERYTVLRSALFSALSQTDRVKVLERLVDAKKLGWVPLSVPVDQAERALRHLTDEEWDEFAAQAEARDTEQEVA